MADGLVFVGLVTGGDWFSWEGFERRELVGGRRDE